jgi:hypothetical protein
MSGGGQAAGGSSFGRLWYLDDKGKLAVMRVHTGISDGKVTEVSGPPQLAAGLKVIVAVTSGKTARTNGTSSASPFQQNRQERHGPPGM